MTRACAERKFRSANQQLTSLRSLMKTRSIIAHSGHICKIFIYLRLKRQIFEENNENNLKCKPFSSFVCCQMAPYIQYFTCLSICVEINKWRSLVTSQSLVYVITVLHCHIVLQALSNGVTLALAHSSNQSFENEPGTRKLQLQVLYSRTTKYGKNNYYSGMQLQFVVESKCLEDILHY